MSDVPIKEIAGRKDARVVVTCEHASERLPDDWTWPDGDRRLLGTHWASDLGAAAIAEEVAATLGAPAILSNFTRLLVDPNRPLDSDTLFRADADGSPVYLNAGIDDAERARRIRRFYEPYHAAVDRVVAGSEAEFVFAVHTYTDNYQGEHRVIEVGTLFDAQEEPARVFNQRICDAGFDARLNEPWSGKEGLAYSAERHAAAYGRRALEIEVRQDLAVKAATRARIVQAIAAFFAEYRDA